MNGEQKTILIADDMPNGRELIRTVLERSGYSVIEAADGQEALEKIHASRPHLVILDLQMPVLDGYGVIRRLRSDPQYFTLPVVAITANAMQGDREKTLAAGFTGYLAKPVSLSILRAELARLLSK